MKKTQMVRRFGALLLGLCMAAPLLPAAHAAGLTSDTAGIGGGSAKLLYFEMGGGVTGEVTLPGGKLGRVQSAAQHVSQKGAEGGKTVVASINGGYFDSYSGSNRVYANVIQNGAVVNGGGETPMLGFTDEGKPLIARVKIESKIVFRGDANAAPTAWSVNNYFTDPNAVTLFTPEQAQAVAVQPDARVVTIRNGAVESISVGGTVLAGAGTRVLVLNASYWQGMCQYYLEPHVGNPAQLQTVYTPKTGSADEWNRVVNGVGAGPLLLAGGQNVVDQNADFTDPKQQPDYVSSRSFAAVMGDGRLLLGSASSASMRQIAQSLLERGAVDAMALDGGASTYLSAPALGTLYPAGRELANVLHIVDYTAGTLPQAAAGPDLETPSGWAKATISDAVSAGLVPAALQNGYQKNITRQEFCQLIGALGKQRPAWDKALSAAEMTYEQANAALTDCWDLDVINCYRLGLVSGVGGNRFDPNASLTREQAAKILMNAGLLLSPSLEAGAPQAFSDEAQISSWAKEGVQYVVARGIMNGTGKNFEPQGLFTREQAIATVCRM
ncbi:S-layer homology domain-containing protein [Agathobaculum sp.]|uniref:S-layer homology domain-containing protein n=1 Tax=Agathobaculum sp. TaxID=2048138 RepID=UPI002A80224E|nr:S-layer homology domain-containing protein [Agathobaculum sp.]MDY3618367.1 S-layer homology domain-containing protein [Agathobaculum sp.]